MPFIKTANFLADKKLNSIKISDSGFLSSTQKVCSSKFCSVIQLEQEKYLRDHPEILAMIEVFVTKEIQQLERKDVLLKAAEHFVRPFAVLDEEIRTRLELPPDGPYLKEKNKKEYDIDVAQSCLMDILRILTEEHELIAPNKTSSFGSQSTSTTLSSSFLSVSTSTLTPLTSEPITPPSPTMSEVLNKMILKTIDKAVIIHFTDQMVIYDIAYVEVMKAVENAMEISVTDIKTDIAKLLQNVYEHFNDIILKKAEIVIQRNWERRMRKKFKKTLRRLDNFKGYTPQKPPKSNLSSHESYKIPPQPPCSCHPQFNYNRYPKDRFGIYLPREEIYEDGNITEGFEIDSEQVINEAENEIKDNITDVPKSFPPVKPFKLKKITKSKKKATELGSFYKIFLQKNKMNLENFITHLTEIKRDEDCKSLQIELLKNMKKRREQHQRAIERNTLLKPLPSVIPSKGTKYSCGKG